MTSHFASGDLQSVLRTIFVGEFRIGQEGQKGRTTMKSSKFTEE